MDRTVYEQLDRIEMAVHKAIDGIKYNINMDGREAIVQFIEAEILDKEGELSHLANDTKVNAFYRELVSDLEGEDDVPEPKTPPLKTTAPTTVSPPKPMGADEYRQR